MSLPDVNGMELLPSSVGEGHHLYSPIYKATHHFYGHSRPLPIVKILNYYRLSLFFLAISININSQTLSSGIWLCPI